MRKIQKLSRKHSRASHECSQQDLEFTTTAELNEDLERTHRRKGMEIAGGRPHRKNYKKISAKKVG